MENIPYRPNGDSKHDEMLKAAFELLARGETVGVFQVESSGMQQMLREMRPYRFEHIIAGISLYRPGPMDYIPEFNARMHGQKEIHYHHPKLEKILAETYGIITYQEQIMQIASELFSYALGDADLMRRAVSKKKKEDLLKHREIFITNGPKNGVDEDAAGKIFDDIEFFANYGFNKCVVASTEIIDAQTGRLYRIGDLAAGTAKIEQTITLDTDKLKLTTGSVAQVWENGVKPVYRLTTQLGRQIEATANHPFYTFDGWRTLDKLQAGEQIAVPRWIPVEGKQEWATDPLERLAKHLAEGAVTAVPLEVFSLNNSSLKYFFQYLWNAFGYTDPQTGKASIALASETLARQLQHLLLRLAVVARLRKIEIEENIRHLLVVDEVSSRRLKPLAKAELNSSRVALAIPEGLGIALGGDFNLRQSALESDIYWDEITSIEYVGEQPTYDLTIPGMHNFVANDIIAHNSHAADYAVITVQTAFLKTHYPHEYMAALLSVYFDDATKVTTLLTECKRLNIPILAPDINYSQLDFDIQPQKDGTRSVRFGMAAIKNAGIGALQHIIAAREEGGLFTSLEDFCQRVDLRHVGKRALESLVKVGALDGVAALTGNTRSQMVEALDRIVAHSANFHKDKEIGQMNMFGGGGQGVKDDLLKNLPPSQNISARDMLNWERELLGLFISSHPIDPVMDKLRHQNIANTYELKEEMPNGKEIRFVGLVAGMRKLPTKNKEMMCITTLEDRYGTIDAVLFPRTWSKYESLVQDGAVIVVSGKFDTSRGDPQIICEHITQQVEAFEAENMVYPQHDTPAWLDDTTSPPQEARAWAPANGGNGKHNGDASYGATYADEPGYLDASPTAYVNASSTPPPSIDDVPPAWMEEAAPNGFYELPPAPHPQRAPRCLTIRYHRSGDDQQDLRRLRRIVGLADQFPGQDRYQILLVEDGVETYLWEFPGKTTDCSEALLQKLLAIDGVETDESTVFNNQ
jgi:hypothetical protein